MAYELADFCKDAHAALKTQPLQAALDDIATRLRALLANPAFVAATFNDETPVGKRELYHDAETDFYVMAHVQAQGKAGAPHSHGSSWAIYGNARGFTEMTKYRRVNGASEEAWALEKSDHYRVNAGDSRGYGPDVIHSTEHPEKAWVVRITGTDLDHLPRFHFKKSRDRMVEAAQ
jgi:hypothetical protein